MFMPKKTIKKSHEKSIKIIAKGAGVAFIGLFLGKFFAYITRLAIARTLGPEAYGLISIALGILTILTTVSVIGLGDGLNRFISFHRGKKEHQKVKSSIISSFKLTLVLSFFLCIFLFIFSDHISKNIFSKPDLLVPLQIISIALPFSVIKNMTSSTLRGFKMIDKDVYIRDIAKNLSTLFLVLIFSFIGASLFNISFAFLFGYIISVVFGFYFLKKHVYPKIKKTSLVPVTKELLSFSYPLYLYGILSIIMGYTDVLMLGYFNTSDVVGIYNAALNTCILIAFVLSSFAFIFLPIISELFAKNKTKEIINLYKISTRWIFSLVLPIFLLFILFPDNILNFLFGAEFVSGSMALVILSIGFLTHVSVGLSMETIIAMGKPKINFYLNSLAAISNFLLNLILIPIYGMIGAAIAMTVALMLKNVLSLFYLNKKTGLWPYNIDYIKPILSSLVSAFLFYFIIKKIFTTSFLNLVLGFTGFLVVYILLFLISGGLKEEDVIILKSIENRVGIKSEFLRSIIKKFIR